MQRLGALPRGSSFGRLPSLAHVGAPSDESRPARVRLAEPCLVIDDNTSVAERLLLALELERAEGEDLRRAVESIHRLRYVRGNDLVADAASLVPVRVR